MSYSSIIKDIVKEQVMGLHVAYIARILSVANGRAKIQPLGKYKEYGKDAQSYPPLEKVPIANSARFKIIDKDTFEPIAKGDLVLCVCCDRNISAALRGENTTPPSGNYHELTNSVIVSIL